MAVTALVGRADELRRLDDALALARGGTPQVVLVEGGAGFGKSALLAAFAARNRHCRTVCWSGDAAESDLPYGLLAHLLDGDARWADPYTAGAALLARVGEATATGPVLLVLDDAHLADRSSLVGLNFALRRLRHDPVMVLLSVRSPSLDTLPASTRRLADEAGNRITLPGLTADAIVDLARELGVGGISRRAAERLRLHAGGSPLHLRTLLAEVPVADLERDDRPVPAPRSFARLVLATLATAPEPARRVATAASVLGERAELAHVLALTRLGADEVLEALDALHRLGFLQLVPGTTVVEFAHPLIRVAVHDDLPPTARVHLHREASTLVGGVAALRHRSAATIGPDADLARDLEERSADEEARGNLRTAADLLVAAHRVSPPGPDRGRRLVAGIHLLAVAGDVRAAAEHLASVEPPAASGLLLAVRARIAWLGGRTAEAADLARRAWDTDDLDPAARDQVAAMLGQIEALADHGDQAATWLRTALRDNRLDPGTAAHTRSQLALGLALAGRLDEAMAAVAELPADPEDVPPERHPELYARGYLRTWSGPPAAALGDLRVAGRLTHGDMQPFRLAAAAAASTALFRAGDWDQCQATCDQTLALARDMDQVWCLGFLHALAALVPAARGDWEAAEAHVASALDLAGRAGEGAPRAYAGEAAALLALCRGDLGAVVTATECLQATAPSAATRDLGMFSWPLYRQEALVRLGRLDEAEAELAALVRRTRPRDLRAAAALDRLAGQLAAARHDPAGARECLSRAVDRADDRVDALERALALDALGRFLRRRGERRAATTVLGTARERYLALRAGPFLDRCDAELAACGVRNPDETLAPDPLTPQERVVATLICAGRTNKEAAAELVVSVKTIGYHLANVHTKLGVHSRSQLIAAMRDLDHPR